MEWEFKSNILLNRLSDYAYKPLEERNCHVENFNQISKRSVTPEFFAPNIALTFKGAQQNKYVENNSQENQKIPAKKHLLLVHGKNVSKPIDRLANANFYEDVYRELLEMPLTEIYPIQAYSWPHLMRGNSVLIVNSSRSGKTLAYLPAICSIIKMKIDDNMIPDSVGPIGIILATSAAEVEKIAQICSSFFTNSTNKLSIVTAYGVRKTNKVAAQLLNGCDILIATVPCLSGLLSYSVELFDNKRIEHIVIDNIDLIHENHKPDLHKIIRKFCMHNTTFVQLVITARSWKPFMTSFLKVCKNLQLCIGSHIEAAAYARVIFSMKLVEKISKGYQIIEYIKEHPYLSERLVIVCSEDEEVEDVVDALKSISAIFVYCTSKSRTTDVEYASGWQYRKCGDMNILVCTDSVLPKLNIRKAQNMISYSLPSSWATFSLRFSVFLDYYEDLIQNDTLRKSAASSFILLDENNMSLLQKLVKFLQDHGECEIIHEIFALSERIHLRQETNNILEMTELCPYLVNYGNCLKSSNCKKRHILTKQDTPDKNFPKEGLIRIKILHVASPTHYCVSLLEKRSIENGSTWIKVNKPDDYLRFYDEFSKYFADWSNRQKHWPVKVGDLCVISDSNMYHRCIVVNANKPITGTSRTNISLHVKLVDIGTIIHCRPSNLLQLPDQYKTFPYQTTDLHLVGVVPHDFEQEWHTNVTKNLEHWFDEYGNDDRYVEASITLSLRNRIWVDNIRIVEKLKEGSNYVQVISIPKSLLQKGFAVPNTLGIDILQKMAFACGIIKNPVYQYNSVSDSPETSDSGVIFYDDYNGSTMLEQPSIATNFVSKGNLCLSETDSSHSSNASNIG